MHESHMVHVMTDTEQARGKRTVGSKLASTVLGVIVPILLLAIIGMIGGAVGIGMVELSLLWAIWVVSLAWVWWPRRG